MSDYDKKSCHSVEREEKERVKQEVDRILEQDVAAKRQAKSQRIRISQRIGGSTTPKSCSSGIGAP